MPLIPPPNPQPSAPLPPASGVPLIDMHRQYAALEGELTAAIQRVCSSGRFVLGPDCQDLERAVATYCQASHAIGCASGSDALLLALMACDVGPGDEVIVPSYTFFATASAVSRLGARPVFVDIEPRGFNIDPDRIEAAITPSTQAIIPVHLYGQCAEMDPIMEIAERHGLTVIEDAAQAIGAEYRGRRAGSIGQMSCFSFYPTKNLGGFGDAGMLTTNDDKLADKLRLLRVHGMQPRYYHQVLGINSRLDSIQAAVLNVKFPHLDRWTELRQGHAARYTELFRAQGLDGVLTLPETLEDRRHVWNQYIVRVPDGRRDALREHLSQRKISTEIYYPVPVHQQQCFASLGVRPGKLPETERAAQQTMALPIFPELTPAEQTLVVQEISAFFAQSPTTAGHGLEAPKFLKRAGSRAEEGKSPQRS